MREQAFAGQACAAPAAAPVRSWAGLGLAQIMAAHVYGVPMEALLAATRREPRAAEARQVAMYLGHVVLGLNLSEVARGFGRDRTTVFHACQRVEELRENAEHDRLVAWLEVMLRCAVFAGVVGPRP